MPEDSESLKSTIADLNQQTEALSRQLTDWLQQFPPAVAPIAGDWIHSETKRRIEENADLVAAGKVDLVALKAAIAALTQRLPELLAAEVSQPARLPHTLPSASTGNESFLASAFRNVVRHLGDALQQHGLLPHKPGEFETWARSTQGHYRYRINTGFEEAAVPCVKAYNEGLARYRRLSDELARTRQALAKAQARELWEST